jgi:hypothetical protein
MNGKQIADMLGEIRDRTVRMESRLVQLGDHVGANLRQKQEIRIYQQGEVWFAEIDALDMSLARVFAMFQQQKVRAASAVLMCKGKRVALLDLQ